MISDLLVFSPFGKYVCDHKHVVGQSSAKLTLFVVKRTGEWVRTLSSERNGMWVTTR